MRIIDHSLDQITSYIVHNQTIRTVVNHDDIATFLRATYRSALLANEQDALIFLLDERLFSYYRFSIHVTCSAPFTIAQLKKYINEKVASVST